MEKFWNILYYFAFQLERKETYYLYKYTGVFKLDRYMAQRNERATRLTELVDTPGYFTSGLLLATQLVVLFGIFMCIPYKEGLQ